VVVPNEVNTLGVSLIADLDKDEDIIDVVGYNAKGNFIISSLKFANLFVPALNQQEGTFVSIDNRVVPTNVALSYAGYTLNDLASACGVVKEKSVDYTAELPSFGGFKNREFDSLENYLSAGGEDERGYLLDEVKCKMSRKLDQIADLPEFNGTIIYNSNPVLQFNAYTNKAKQLEKENTLRGSAQFAAAAKISDGDRVEIQFGSKMLIREFKLDATLKGTIALNPTFDDVADASRYKFEKSKIMRVTHE
jgi:NADH-quinone oxidoreductase subunit G